MFKFLNELRANNNREWFLNNKDRYGQLVRDPVLRFIADLQDPLHKINRHIVADTSPTQGSMMRIYRDIRFSRDKSPYKTSVSAHFWHDKGKEGATPAYYLHLEPRASLIGAGIWRPEPRALKKIRDAIAKDPKQWKGVTSGALFGSKYKMGGEALQRPPLGYDPQHAFIEDIKRRDFTIGQSLTDNQVLGGDFLDLTLASFRQTAPFLQFLSEAIGLPW